MDKDGPETMREAVARAIDPRPFWYWDEMVNFCLSQGHDDETARHYADQTHGPEIEATLKKADAAIRTVLERLREPGDDMLNAGGTPPCTVYMGGPSVLQKREAKRVWQAMLAAITPPLPESADSGSG